MSVLGWRGVGEGRGSAGGHRSPAGLHCSGPHPLQGQRFLGMTLNHPLFPCPVPAYLPEKRKNQAPLGGSKLPTQLCGLLGPESAPGHLLCACLVPQFPFGDDGGVRLHAKELFQGKTTSSEGLGEPLQAWGGRLAVTSTWPELEVAVMAPGAPASLKSGLSSWSLPPPQGSPRFLHAWHPSPISARMPTVSTPNLGACALALPLLSPQELHSMESGRFTV